MKISKFNLIKLALPLLIVAGALSLMGGSAKAATTFNFSDTLMDDATFRNSQTMNSSDIQSFLVSKNSGLKSYTDTETCDPIVQPYSGTYYTHCGSTVSAATIIYDAAQAYGINPRVILATLQKEQSLITTPSPTASQLNFAMGYGCPDSGGCSFSGFFNQVDNGTWQMRTDYELGSGNNWWGYTPTSYPCNGATRYYSAALKPGNNVIFYDDNGTNYANFTLPNMSTAVLYCYTPHVFNNPNGINGLPRFGTTGQYYTGSYNFVNSYNLWWPPDYAWQINTFTYNPTMGVGSTQTVTLTATNTGRQPWYNQNANPNAPIRLGTWQPGRQSPFANGSWLNSTRPANMSPSEVDQGQTATFSFTLSAPTVTGSYVEPLNLVFEGYQWLPWPGFSPTINVVNPYSWQLNSVNYSSGTGYMAPGTSQTITVSALNTGTATWSNTGSVPIRLGTWQPGRQSPVASGWIDSTRPVAVVGPGGASTVAPNQVGTFTFNVYMPDGGQHYERFNVLAEGVTWFNDPGLTLYLQGQSYAWQPLWFSPSTGTWTMSPGQHFILTMQAKNTGTTTWYKDGQGSFPVHLATNGPQNRGSALYTPSWLSSIRPTGLVQNSVPPGGEGTFTFNAVAPTVTGPRFEAFNLVAEGIAWFNDPGFGFTVNVQ